MPEICCRCQLEVKDEEGKGRGFDGGAFSRSKPKPRIGGVRRGLGRDLGQGGS